jgi:hypothetical protein
VSVPPPRDVDAARPRWRVRTAQVVFALVVVAQLSALVHFWEGPHRVFAFEPFREASSFQVVLVRVTVDGERVPVDGSSEWSGYRWAELVDTHGLGSPFDWGSVSYGVDVMLDHLDHALDWVADHTPADHETLYYEATVTSSRNTRPRETVVLRSHDRDVATARG